MSIRHAARVLSPTNADGKLVRRAFRRDRGDRSVVLAMTQGIGAHLNNEHPTNEYRRAPLRDIGREALIDQVCVQEILPPEK